MNNQTVYVFAKWQAKKGNTEKIVSLLTDVIKQTREEPGNLLYKVHRAIADPDTILLYEAYVDESAVADHRNSEHFRQIVVEKIIPLLENREVTLASSVDE